DVGGKLSGLVISVAIIGHIGHFIVINLGVELLHIVAQDFLGTHGFGLEIPFVEVAPVSDGQIDGAQGHAFENRVLLKSAVGVDIVPPAAELDGFIFGEIVIGPGLKVKTSIFAGVGHNEIEVGGSQDFLVVFDHSFGQPIIGLE